jgi:hypothetical protein
MILSDEGRIYILMIETKVLFNVSFRSRAITTQRFKEMNQLPTDTPSHVKALNKLEREAGTKEQSHNPI